MKELKGDVKELGSSIDVLAYNVEVIMDRLDIPKERRNKAQEVRHVNGMSGPALLARVLDAAVL